jgi:taurine dioxygenase
MYLAYDALSEGLKRLLSGLRAVNSAEKPDAAVTRINRIADRPVDASEIITTVAHPIVRTHPETGRKALYCSDAHSTKIEGLTIDESRPLLRYLYSVQQREEFQCRFHWEQGSMAIWDNRCAQHNALNDYHGYNRAMYRVTLEGDQPS